MMALAWFAGCVGLAIIAGLKYSSSQAEYRAAVQAWEAAKESAGRSGEGVHGARTSETEQQGHEESTRALSVLVALEEVEGLGVRVDSISLDTKDRSVLVRARAEKDALVPAYLGELERSKWVKGVQLGSQERVEHHESPTEIAFSLKGSW